MNGDFCGEDVRPVFMCFQSGHQGPYMPSSIYHRGAACRDCYTKVAGTNGWPAFPTENEPGIATQIARQERRAK